PRQRPSQAQVREGFPGRGWFRRRCGAGLCPGRARRQFSRGRTQLLVIDVVTGLDALRAQVSAWRRDGLRIGFVPTMGNLHAGHFSLIGLARRHADRVVASVFVNPTQFGPNEDYGRYPRTPQQDADGLEAAGCDLLWMPSVEQMYPLGVDA